MKQHVRKSRHLYQRNTIYRSCYIFSLIFLVFSINNYYSGNGNMIIKMVVTMRFAKKDDSIQYLTDVRILQIGNLQGDAFMTHLTRNNSRVHNLANMPQFSECFHLNELLSVRYGIMRSHEKQVCDHGSSKYTFQSVVGMVSLLQLISSYVQDLCD